MKPKKLKHKKILRTKEVFTMSMYSYMNAEEELVRPTVSGLEAIWKEIVWDETYGTIKE